MYSKLTDTISFIQKLEISQGRNPILRPLVEYIQHRLDLGKDINLNFICTHNSRRSHLCQVWAQIAAAHYQVPKVYCYSGGTEETALFPKIADTLRNQGVDVQIISEAPNPIYALKYDINALPIIGFSKKYDDPFNPQSDFAAIMTCSQADGGCPFIPGAEKRIPITFEDPKLSDNTPQQDEVYHNRSLEIAAEMFYVFSQIK
ncbi:MULTISPECIES: low molecular weight phosphatase family protein [Sphingobacterium]|uniref:arsenate-mycothiol transferase ArsC n=1 Tax=Sphingobacterium TaxID=28453 RepID=UPI0013DB75DA|nr:MULTISPECIES: protein-tyrosine-phosphatase [unclassified Sphingobacterium]